MVAAAHDSFTGNNLQEDWGDATDDSNAAPGKKHAGVANDKEIEAMPPPRKKRSASCDGEECEDDEDGKERAAALSCVVAKMLRKDKQGLKLPLAKVYTLTLMIL